MIPFGYNLRSLMARPFAAFAAVISVAAAVFVFACTEMLVANVRATAATHGAELNVILLGRGSSGEATSRISENEARLLDTLEDFALLDNDARGAAELVVTLRPGGGGRETITLRGITPASLAVRPYVDISDGRALRFGSDEVMVGSATVGRLGALGILQNGAVRLKDGRAFPITGTFDARGAPLSAEVWMDLQTLRAFFADASALSAYTARLHAQGGFEATKARLAADARLDVDMVREREYFGERSRGLGIVLQGIAIVLSFVMLVGALLGAMAVMLALVRARMREIGTLKALGFERTQILRAFLIETCVVAWSGGAIGIGAAMAMRFLRVGALEGASGELVALAFVPSPATLLSSALLAVAIGLGAGFVPSIFASRVSPMEAIRG